MGIFFTSPSLEQVLNLEKTFYNTLKSYWYEHNYLTPQWWLLIFFSIIPAIIWWMLVDKNKIFEIMTFGLIFGTIASILDSIGSNAMAWTYPVRISPYLYPQFYPFNVALVIVPFMLIYQWSINNTKKFFLLTIIVAGSHAFIGEPLLQWMGIYKQITWKHLYSFPIYILLGLICRWIVTYLKNKTSN